MSLDHSRIVSRIGKRCEARKGMRTSAADTNITHKNKACALREKQ
jgi:hypothetical protein